VSHLTRQYSCFVTIHKSFATEHKVFVVCKFSTYLSTLIEINLTTILTLRSAFLPSISVNILSSSLYCHYLFQPNWPSSGVLVVMESAALL
jgi:hypothetical protein